jgi:hypothetical protein
MRFFVLLKGKLIRRAHKRPGELKVAPIAFIAIGALLLSPVPSFAASKAKPCSTRLCKAKAAAARAEVAKTKAKAGAKSSPTPTPTPTIIPYSCTSTPLNPGLSGPLAQCSYDEISKQLDSQTAVTPQISVDQSPNAITRLLAPTLKSLSDGVRFWQQVTPSGTSVKVVFASNSDWAWFIPKMTYLQPTNVEYLAVLHARSQACPQCVYAGSNGGTVDGDQLFWFMPVAQTDPTDFNWSAAGPHEWTHFAQQTLLGEINLIPCWLKEGQATYYGDAIGMRNRVAWAAAWRTSIRELDRNGLVDYRTLSQAQILQWFNAHDETIPATSCGPGGTFIMGAMASEYLLGTLGHQGMVDFLRDTRRTHDWRISLSKSLGVPISTAMDQITSFVTAERDWALKDG